MFPTYMPTVKTKELMPYAIFSTGYPHYPQAYQQNITICFAIDFNHLFTPQSYLLTTAMYYLIYKCLWKSLWINCA